MRHGSDCLARNDYLFLLQQIPPILRTYLTAQVRHFIDHKKKRYKSILLDCTMRPFHLNPKKDTILCRIIVSIFLISILLGENALSTERSDSLKLHVNALKIDGDIKLTGKMDDPNWKLASPVEIKYEVTPGDNTPAPQRTLVRTMYNSQYVYFGFECSDTKMSDIRAHITDRDRPYNDDWVLVILDTYGDYQRSYEFLVNPYGIQADLLRTSNNEDDSFDTVWESAAAMNGTGWTAEMAIPFKSIRFPSKPDQRWVVEFMRNYPRASRVQISWVPLDRDNPCLPCQSGIIDGINNLQTTTSVDMLPYVVSQQRGELENTSTPSSQFHEGKISGRVGGGVRYAPTPDLAVEGVINPDFSQVESDAAQISVNSTFSLFYSEKRPFFLLGGDLFQTRTQTYYSRTINNPLVAARVIGKTGGLSFAYLAASDRNTPYIVPGEESSDYIATDITSFSNVARARYDFGKEAFLGSIVTLRNSADAHNYTAGIDWNYKFWENFYFAGETFYTHTKELNDTNLLSSTRAFGNSGYNAALNGEQYGGTAEFINLRRDARDYSFGIQYTDRSPTFQGQDGFITSNNTRLLNLSQNYTFYPNNAFIDHWSISANSGLHYNHEGVHKETWFLPNAFAQFKGQTNISLFYFAVNDEKYHGVEFDHIFRTEVSVNTRPTSLFFLSFDGTFGRFIRRTDNPEMGTGHNISLSGQFTPTPQLEVDISYSRARLSSVNTGALFYDGYVTRATGIFQFSREIFLRVIGQYDEFGKNLDFYPLVSYKLNPYTIFYAGSTYSLSDFGNPYGLRQTSHQYFMKLQYLIRS